MRSKPNLQNIPIPGRPGRAVAAAFTGEDAGASWPDLAAREVRIHDAVEGALKSMRGAINQANLTNPERTVVLARIMESLAGGFVMSAQTEVLKEQLLKQK